VVNEIGVVPTDDKIALLGWNYWAASEGGVYIEGGSLCVNRGINDDGPDFIECPPVAPEIPDIDLVVNG